MGFPALVALIILIGVVVVVVARIQRDAESEPGLDDHWHSAYGVWDCTTEAWQPAFQNTFDPLGIHSHQDGIIHIHPFSANSSGEDASLSVFFEAMNARMDQNGIGAAEFGLLSAVDSTCDGQPAVTQIVRWSDALGANASFLATGEVPPPDERIYEDFGEVRFKNDGEAFTIALAPVDAELPLPTTIPILAEVSPSLLSTGPVTSLPQEDIEAPGVGVDDGG